MLSLLWLALRGAIIQIMLAVLTSSFMKELIIVGLKKLAVHTDNDLDDKIISLIDDAVHGKLKDSSQAPESEEKNAAKICPTCQTILD